MKDKVKVLDRLTAKHGSKTIISEPIEDAEDKEVVQITGFFSAVCRERGKIVPGSYRGGKNIWTLSGREFLARLMSYAAYGSPDTPARNDRIRYIGFGTGSQPEVSSVTSLVTPTPYSSAGGGQFLAEMAIPTYPFQTSGSFGTAAQYTREFSESELSISGTVILSEAGLFTDGSPTNVPAYAPKTRVLTMSSATEQAPDGYKVFEPLKKTVNFVLQASWEVRF